MTATDVQVRIAMRERKKGKSQQGFFCISPAKDQSRIFTRVMLIQNLVINAFVYDVWLSSKCKLNWSISGNM